MDGAAHHRASLELQRSLRGDRKLLAAFYTTPAAATLLAHLAIDAASTPTRIADFSCGAGALLAAVHRRIAPRRASRASQFFGCDVVAEAARRSAALVSAWGDGHRVRALPYGVQRDGSVALGAIDLLRDDATGSFDLVIMNPPYARATGHEGAKIGVPVPMFAAFGSRSSAQHAMAKAFRSATRGTCAHGNAGEASAFLALAHAKLLEGGRLALILPLSLLAGEAWRRSRALLRSSFRDLVVVTIAGRGSFSSDTSMGECMLVATRAKKGSARATFVVLDRAPDDEHEGSDVADAVRAASPTNVARLEDRTSGGTAIAARGRSIASMMDAPIDDGPWRISRIRDLSLAQHAHGLATSKIVTRLGSIARIGPYHMDISGTERVGGATRGPFDVGIVPSSHPMLWSHRADAERTMIVAPDCEAVIRSGKDARERSILDARARAIAATASHAHVNRDFRFNSQSLAAAFTEAPTIGGRAWPSVIFDDVARAKALALWCNTTFGLLLYWWTANKAHHGRGSIPVVALRDLPTLDLSSLPKTTLRALATAFDDFGHVPLAPMNEIDVDEARARIDRRVLRDILDLPRTHDAELCALRSALAREPSIAGSKRRISEAPPTSDRRARRSRGL